MSYDETSRRIAALTDHQAFERLVTILLARTGLNIRPLGGSGDRGRDAVAGLYTAATGEDLAVTISLNATWAAKIKADVARIHNHGLKPRAVVSVTNRSTGAKTQTSLQQTVNKERGVDLTIYDQRWLITQMHLRDNLDLRAEFLNLPAPRPRFFLDIGEFGALLQRRGMLEAPVKGRDEDLENLERLLDQERRAVILEADGGYGKTRLAYELARSGRSATQWFFVDRGLDFNLDYLAEVEAGYDATVLVDDAHRRRDLEQLVRSLERRDPVPRLALTVRPGHSGALETMLHELALRPRTSQLGAVGRSALNAILEAPPFEIRHEGMRGAIIATSEGNVGIALIAGTLAAQGIEPYALSQAELFSQHVDLRLRGAGVGSRETREVLALVASLGSIDVSNQVDVASATALLGGDAGGLRRQLTELADSGIVVEQSEQVYTIKPDIVREHLLRASFFPDSRRPVLRYVEVWNAFSARHLPSMLASLGEARIDTAPAAAEALRTVRSATLQLLDAATTDADLSAVAELARALGAGGAEIGLELVARICDRAEGVSDDSLDALGARLVEALAVAKFGTDQLPSAWRLLLRLATILTARDAPQAQEAALNELRGIYSSVPMNYSPGEAYVLAYVQQTIREQTLEWWEDIQHDSASTRVAAAVVRAAFQLELESHRTSAGNAMAITLLGGFIPATSETEALLRFGARLFTDTFLSQAPIEQLKELEAVNSLSHVADGYAGLFGTSTPKDLQELARNVLRDIEEWLTMHLEDVPLAVAAAVVSYFRLRRRRPRMVPTPRPKGELRTYIELVDNHPHGRIRLDWERELDELRARGARYGSQLAKARAPLAELRRWDGWIEQCETLTGNPAKHETLNAALEQVARIDFELARDLAGKMIEEELSIARYSDWLLDALAADTDSWPMIEAWTQHSSPTTRRAAARAVHRAPDPLLRVVTKALANDPDASVRHAVWQALTYGSTERPTGWRLNRALDLAESSDKPLELLNQLLSLVRLRTPDEARAPRLTADQRKHVRRIVLSSATVDDIPRQQRVRMTLEEVGRYGLDLVLPWMRARLEHVKASSQGRYINPLPDEMQSLVYTRRKTAAGRRELERLLDEVEKPSTTGMYRFGVDEAITWLGSDSREVTRRIAKWARGSERQRRLAFSFLSSSSWRVFTQRARVLLDARPHNQRVREALMYAREPHSFIGSRSPYFQARADEFRRWLRASDPRLRQLGREAIAHYEVLVRDEAERDRREREGF